MGLERNFFLAVILNGFICYSIRLMYNGIILAIEVWFSSSFTVTKNDTKILALCSLTLWLSPESLSWFCYYMGCVSLSPDKVTRWNTGWPEIWISEKQQFCGIFSVEYVKYTFNKILLIQSSNFKDRAILYFCLLKLAIPTPDKF